MQTHLAVLKVLAEVMTTHTGLCTRVLVLQLWGKLLADFQKKLALLSWNSAAQAGIKTLSNQFCLFHKLRIGTNSCESHSRTVPMKLGQKPPPVLHSPHDCSSYWNHCWHCYPSCCKSWVPWWLLCQEIIWWQDAKYTETCGDASVMVSLTGPLFPPITKEEGKGGPVLAGI